MNNTSNALSALNYLDPSCKREAWVRAGMAAKAAGLSFQDFHKWSMSGDNYKSESDCKAAWDSFKQVGGITANSLFYLARKKGWLDSGKLSVARISICNQVEKSELRLGSVSAKFNALDIWERCLPATVEHSYIIQKQGLADGVRFYPNNKQELIISNINVAGYLVVPCISNNEIQTLQFIPPNEGRKLNLPKAKFNDGYFTVGMITDSVYIVESIGNAWAVYKTLGAASVVCFSSGRMARVSKVLPKEYPGIRLIVVADRGKEIEASEIAKTINGVWVQLPQSKPNNYDVNDYLIEHGENALHDLLIHSLIEMPLSVMFADELPEDFIPPDELVEGILTIGDGSVLYGDSNSGKTFFVIDMACAVARGVDWMGRKTEAGLVIYLAAESPASVRSRLQAYQKYNDIRVRNFAIVQSPINLFDGDADTNAVIRTIHLLEKQLGQKARFIVGDTLARLSAGANESAGQDMGLVVRHFDRIRSECNAHFMLIHHSGKNAAAGARGWSGVRAAVDTEIEITDSPTGRCAEITKQRDLSTKGDRIGFSLEPIALGLTKWSSLATSCVVVAADAPSKTTGKRLSEVGGAVIEYLTTCSSPIKKRELVKHFEGRYDSSTVYRELKKLVNAAHVTDRMGYVNIVVRINANTNLHHG